MTKYILQRIGFALLTVMIIIIIVYLLSAQFTQNPFAQTWLTTEDKTTISVEESLFNQSVVHKLIADVPFAERGNWFTDSARLSPVIRFFYWVQSVFSSRPFGTPYNAQTLTNADVTNIPSFFFTFLQYTLIITAPVFVLSTIFGVSLGVVSGYKRGTIFDTIINGFTLVFTAIPSFVLAPIIITLLLSQNIPPVFYIWDEARILTDGWGRIITSWLPPIGVLTILFMSGYIAFVRNQVITVLTSNYVLIAKSKGLGTREIFFKYVLRNISIPLVSAIIPSFFGILTGGVIIETYWRVPGVSRVLVSSFPSGEVNLIMFSVTFFTTLGVFITILVDSLYVVLDPRIKYVAASKRSIVKQIKARLFREKTFKGLENSKTLKPIN